MSASLFADVELRATRPDPRSDRGVQPRPAPPEGQPGRRRLFRRRRADSGAARGGRGRAPARRRSPPPRGYLPIEGIAAYDAAVQQLLLGTELARDRAGPRRSPRRRSAERAACASAPSCCGACCRARLSRSVIRAGKTTARSSRARDSESSAIPTTTRQRRALDFAACSPACAPCPRVRSSCCMRAVTTPPAST